MTEKNSSFVSFVVYLYNNDSTVSSFLKRMINIASSLFCNYEFVCVDDGSSDNTVNEVKNVDIFNDGTLTLIEMGAHQGYEKSMEAAIQYSIGDFIYEFDDIFIDYDDKIIGELFEKMGEGYDVVSAVNENYRRVSSRVFYHFFNKYSNTFNKIGSEKLRIVSRRAINRVESMGVFVTYHKYMYSNCGLSVSKIYYGGSKDSNMGNKGERLDSAVSHITPLAHAFR